MRISVSSNRVSVTVRYARIPDEEGAFPKVDLLDLFTRGIILGNIDQSSPRFVLFFVIAGPLLETMSESRNTMESFGRPKR